MATAGIVLGAPAIVASIVSWVIAYNILIRARTHDGAVPGSGTAPSCVCQVRR